MAKRKILRNMPRIKKTILPHKCPFNRALAGACRGFPDRCGARSAQFFLATHLIFDFSVWRSGNLGMGLGNLGRGKLINKNAQIRGGVKKKW